MKPKFSLWIPSVSLPVSSLVFETECSAAECTYSFGTAKERWKNDTCWDEVPKMTYWGVNEKIHSHYLFVVTPQQWVQTPIRLEESGCPERHVQHVVSEGFARRVLGSVSHDVSKCIANFIRGQKWKSEEVLQPGLPVIVLQTTSCLCLCRI